MPARVVLAMSGGVDSSVAAYLLKQQGYDVVGLFMRTGVASARRADTHAPHKKGCCSAVDAGDARRVADRLDIPFYALDFEDDFDADHRLLRRRIRQGRTPNPCVVCNNWLKFGKLWSYGKQLDADFVATGHYAQMIRTAAVTNCTAAPIRTRTSRMSCSACDKTVLPHVVVPDRRLSQGRGSGPGTRGRPGRRRQAGQRGNLLRAGQRSCRLHQQSPSRAWRRPATSSIARATSWPRTAASRITPSASARASASAPASAAMCWRSSRKRDDVVIGDREDLLAPGSASPRASTG